MDDNELRSLDDDAWRALLICEMQALPSTGTAALQVAGLRRLLHQLELRGPGPDQDELRSMFDRYGEWLAQHAGEPLDDVRSALDALAGFLEVESGGEPPAEEEEEEEEGGFLLGEDTGEIPPLLTPSAPTHIPPPPSVPPPSPSIPPPPGTSIPSRPPASASRGMPRLPRLRLPSWLRRSTSGEGAPAPDASFPLDEPEVPAPLDQPEPLVPAPLDQPEPHVSTPADQPARQWRTDIEDHDPAMPLDVGHDYTFMLSVDAETSGAIATERFDEAMFVDPSVQSRTVTVQVSSSDFDIRGDAVQQLVVPRAGPTAEPARFEIAARRTGACTLTATVHLDGNFVTLLHFTAWAGTPGPATLTSVGRPPDALKHLEPRDMMLVLQRSSRGGFECIPKAGGAMAPTVYLPITPDELADEVEHVQQELMRVIELRDTSGQLVFQTGVQIPPPQAQEALLVLAKAGGRLFRKLFFHPAAGMDAKELGNYLRTEASDSASILTLQIMGESAVPWALLYVGDISDGAALDWQQFLGMRHLIEQFPLGPLLPGRSQKIPSTPRLAVGLNVNLNIGGDLVNASVNDHSRRWEKLPDQRAGLALASRNTRADVLTALKDPSNGDQIAYFYCHATAQGRDGDTGKAAIILEPGSPLTLDDLTDNAGPDVRLANQPVVFINACESAELSPLFYTGFVPYFLSRGARGVVGTLCKTPALFAIRFAEVFFDRLFDGQPIGEAMLATRRDFLDRYRNPLGLLYAVHCDIDTRIDPAMRPPGP